MALIKCPDCTKEVSSQAAACIHCGAPLKRAADPAHVVTTQQTSKKYKGMQLAGALLMAGGVVACTGGSDPGTAAYMLLGGFGLYVGARIAGWWDHG